MNARVWKSCRDAVHEAPPSAGTQVQWPILWLRLLFFFAETGSNRSRRDIFSGGDCYVDNTNNDQWKWDWIQVWLFIFFGMLTKFWMMAFEICAGMKIPGQCRNILDNLFSKLLENQMHQFYFVKFYHNENMIHSLKIISNIKFRKIGFDNSCVSDRE